jgi:hypothetical protein
MNANEGKWERRLGRRPPGAMHQSWRPRHPQRHESALPVILF